MGVEELISLAAFIGDSDFGRATRSSVTQLGGLCRVRHSRTIVNSRPTCFILKTRLSRVLLNCVTATALARD